MTTQTKKGTYTPGPWRFEYDIRGVNGQIVAYNEGAFDDSEGENNARLIAAAPTLLSCLKTFIELEREAHFEEQAHDVKGCAYCEAVEVVKKAEGRE